MARGLGLVVLVEESMHKVLNVKAGIHGRAAQAPACVVGHVVECLAAVAHDHVFDVACHLFARLDGVFNAVFHTVLCEARRELVSV